MIDELCNEAMLADVAVSRDLMQAVGQMGWDLARQYKKECESLRAQVALMEKRLEELENQAIEESEWE